MAIFDKEIRGCGAHLPAAVKVILLSSLAVFTACNGQRDGAGHFIEYVENILADTTSREYAMLSSFRNNITDGTICVMGEPEDVAAMSEAILVSDRYDNISGKSSHDYLPDFAGETVAPIFDLCGAPYYGYCAIGNHEYLRELTVKNFLSAVDTSCLYTPYDKEHKIGKKRSKIIVISSSYACAFGYKDIDTLCRVSGASAYVVPALQSMFEDASALGHSVVWSDSAKIKAGVYSKMKMPEGDIYASEYDGNTLSKVLRMLDGYKSSGDTCRIASIVIDNALMHADSLSAALDIISACDEDWLVPYRGMLSANIKVITPESAAIPRCYKHLRKTNTFTHKVAYPDIKAYMTVPATELSLSSYAENGVLNDEYKYDRAAGSSVNTFYLIELRPRYVTEQLLEMLKGVSPKVYSYVSQ